MPENREHGKARITLEQLLALKRSERPGGAFWEDFDREFQRRRLATLVNTLPWYLSAFRVITRVSRRIAPLAAVAAAGVFGYVQTSSDTPTEAQHVAPQVSVNDREARFTILEEEYVSPAQQVLVSAETEPTPAPERLHFSIREIGMISQSPRQFVTVAAPHVLAVSDEDSGSHVVRTLTAGPAFGTSARPASASF
ncbi:MAG TPA: hypothetical protein VGA56_00245 [Opitutaceae bacterium]